MKPLSRLALSALLLSLAARTANAQASSDHSYRWYWGAQAGGMVYHTNAQGYYLDPVIGGHWLITAKRVALYMGAEEAFFLTDARATIADQNSATGLRDATFSRVRRLFMGVVAFPLQRRIEPFAGGGFAVMTISDATADCSGTTANSQCATINEQFAAQSLVDDAGSKAAAWVLGGVQINMGKLAVFGQYMLTSAASGFLISGTTHTFQGGIRYSLGSSKEDVATQH
jgi:hypothetical protein